MIEQVYNPKGGLTEPGATIRPLKSNKFYIFLKKIEVLGSVGPTCCPSLNTWMNR